AYDLRCTRGTEERHVEVKGTTGAATSVELTINEALHARDQGRGAPCPQWQKPSRSGTGPSTSHIHPWTAALATVTDATQALTTVIASYDNGPAAGLLLLAAAERAPHDPDVAALVAEGITALEDALRPSHGDAAPQLASTVLGARLRLRAQPPASKEY
ncbi:protein NO VEIN domain-containing protein, partial [Streptomyces sp. NPDC056689]|uniref:protein NO VEIN domain-containing protein n=1 Tax=Streptomyces sp. NPDC056689 TaxID=3345911 RepID=UPI00369318E8